MPLAKLSRFMSEVRVSYKTYEFDDIDVHIRSLRDNQQFSDTLGEAEALGISSAQWPLFGIVWQSGEILAREMADFNIEGKRILEVGCGIALSSHLLNSRDADITATDLHPEAGQFIVENVRLNNTKQIPFLRANWTDVCEGLGLFDVIIGSDILYEKNHIEQLSSFIDSHAKPRCEVVVVDPGRSHHAPFTKKMISLGYSHSQKPSAYSEIFDGKYNGQVLNYRREESVI